MAGTRGGSPPDLIEELLSNPEQFDFFQAVRLIEQAVAEQKHAQTVSRVGGDEGPHTEPLRFHALPSLTFPAGDISGVRIPTPSTRDEPATDEKTPPGTRQTEPLPWPVHMTVPFMGLIGPNGTLPQHYTSLVIERIHLRRKDYALREFLDLFNHRAISLFYRAWEKYRFPFAFERTLRDGTPNSDMFTTCLFSLVGLGLRPLRERFSFDDHAILFYGGLFAARTRNARCLEQCLSSYFGIQASVQQFCGRWLYLPEDSQSSLPTSARPGGLNCALGESTVVGSQVWDVQSRIRITVGPLTWNEFTQLLPGKERLKSLTELIRFYTGIELDFDVQLILRRQEVPLCRLAEDDSYQPRLGWDTWIGGAADSDSDVGDAVFRF